MIFASLVFLETEMNTYFQQAINNNETQVILSPIVNPDGSLPLKIENKIIITLLNIEEDIQHENIPPVTRRGGNTTPPYVINLYVLFSAFFSAANYKESLKHISLVLSFFKERPVFTAAHSPGLDKPIEKISIEIVNLDAEKLNYTWAALGAKYMPSVVYKLHITGSNTGSIQNV